MTGRYFRDNADYRVGPTHAKDIAKMLEGIRQDILRMQEMLVQRKANEPEVIEESVRQLQAVDVKLSDKLRKQSDSTSAEIALKWVNDTLRKVKEQYLGIENLCDAETFETAYINVYAAYEAIVRQVIEDHEERGLIEYLESVLVAMDELADRVAAREECQRPMLDSPKTGKNQVDWLKLLTSEEA